MKLCRDCKHVTADFLCEKCPVYDVVAGHKTLISCSEARSNDFQCGRDAKLFEPSEEFKTPEAA